MIDYSERHEAAAKYMPTPAQIARDCKAIQKTWSPGEERRRRGLRHYDDEGVDVRICRAEDGTSEPI